MNRTGQYRNLSPSTGAALFKLFIWFSSECWCHDLKKILYDPVSFPFQHTDAHNSGQSVHRNPFSNVPYSPAIRLCLGDGTADLSAALAGGKTGLGLEGLSLGNSLVGLGEDELDVAGVGHVGVDLDSYQWMITTKE